MDNLELAQIEERANKATPGPWKHQKIGDGPSSYVRAPRLSPGHSFDIEVLGEDRNPPYYPPEQAFADGEFIAHARTDIPNLINQVKQLSGGHELPAGVHNDYEAREMTLIEERDALRAQLVQLSTPMPIEQAPRDGTQVLGWFPDKVKGGGNWEITYFQSGPEFEDIEDFIPRWTTAYDDVSNGESGCWHDGALIQPTFYFPLPDKLPSIVDDEMRKNKIETFRRTMEDMKEFIRELQEDCPHSKTHQQSLEASYGLVQCEICLVCGKVVG